MNRAARHSNSYLPSDSVSFRNAASAYHPGSARQRRKVPQKTPVINPVPAGRDLAFWLRVVMIFSVSGIIFLLPPLALLGGLVIFRGGASIAPGVHAAGVSLGGKTMEEAAADLHRVWNLEQNLQAASDSTSFTVSPREAGLSLDTPAIAWSAYQVGRHGNLLDSALELWEAIGHPEEIPSHVKFDRETARRWLVSLAPAVERPAINASLRLVQGQIIIVPSEAGSRLAVEATLDRLEVDPSLALFSGKIELIMEPVEAQFSDLTPLAAEAERLLSQTIHVKAYDAIRDEWLDWIVPADRMANWLQVDANPDGSPKLSLDKSQIQIYLESLSASLKPDRWLDLEDQPALLEDELRQGRLPVYTVRHAAASYTVQPGDTLIRIAWKVGMTYWRIARANPQVDPDALVVGQTLVIPSLDELLPYSVVIGKRIIISISEQRMHLYENGSQVAEYIISTGIDRSPTQPGVFQIQTHEIEAYASVWDLYMPHFMGIYEAAPGFMNGIHGLPTLSSGQRLWANILGRPASFGCIILNLQEAASLFDWAETGVVVEIIN